MDRLGHGGLALGDGVESKARFNDLATSILSQEGNGELVKKICGKSGHYR